MSKDLSTNIRKLIGQGECLSAYDRAMSACKQTDDNAEYQYLATLALARSGATNRAMSLFEEYGFADSDNEDYAALGARLSKDLALLSDDAAEQQSLFGLAARQYHAIFKRTAGYYSAINAASLYKLAGDTSLASELAETTIQLCEQEATGEGVAEYYRLASLAEAQLLLDNLDEAEALLGRARQHLGDDYAAMATTRRQLALLLPAEEQHRLAALSPPAVIHYCGHMISNSNDHGRFLPQAEDTIKQAISKTLAELNIGFAYGSLASGADILFAEALLARGASLHVVLPFDMDEFIKVSVQPAGTEWVERFHKCIDTASFVSYSCDGSYLGDNILFHYATRLGMGLALQQARNLQTSVIQLAVWDGETADGAAGTYADIQAWISRGNKAVLLNSLDGSSLPQPQVKYVKPTELTTSHRRAHAMLFGDVKGFSKLSDNQIPAFVEHILGTLGKALEPFADKLLSVNTWGDGLFVVLDDALSATQCALALQDAMGKIDLAAVGLPAHLALRLGAHYGPVYELQDPVLHRPNYFGAHVSKTARIEPVTPEGEVYVTRQLAAELELYSDRGFTTEYVGIMPAAKKYGDMPMYLLRRS